MKEQIEILESQARIYLIMAKLMEDVGNTYSMKMYANQGKKCCEMAMNLKTQWDNDSTGIYQIAA